MNTIALSRYAMINGRIIQSMFDVNLGTLEPTLCIDMPPDNRPQHRRTVHKTRPVHELRRQIASRIRRQAEDRQHEEDEQRADSADKSTRAAEIPRAGTETVTDEKDADSNGDSEGDELGDGADGEECADGDVAGEDEQAHEGAEDGVGDDRVDRGFGPGVDFFPDTGEREAVVAGVGVGNA